eukprot:CAMPEP_0172562802 /NCGR_PEP_ID=MMETSP1067-20121228/98506_1 /TAXON_ID=265564 ORGANISM="Thalassiosira punctigera, Strain Tpunct2005C2" /NCGR_SAMPLE_ID=MMETSP1067 /ASSEMBLY_ACC=CAM_ASM_000444 /LENGTH=108 /DNA_ID=CAMNT_0013353107 /DNA_START=8 /DNA_END=331 /DNA_ORIENTATION=+
MPNSLCHSDSECGDGCECTDVLGVDMCVCLPDGWTLPTVPTGGANYTRPELGLCHGDYECDEGFECQELPLLDTGICLSRALLPTPEASETISWCLTDLHEHFDDIGC